MSLAGFNPRNVLRQTSNGLLEEMFGGLKIPIDVNWSESIETDVEPIFQAYQSLEEPTRQKIELLLRDLHSMVTESGQRSIFQQAIQIGEDDFLAELERFDSRYDVAMLTYLSKPEVWQVATRFAAADRVIGGRSSQRRINLPSAKPRTSPQHMKSFSGALSAFYSAHQGRGRQCVAEYLLRCENLHYVFASLDDYRKTFMKLIDGGNAFKRVCETHVFENVFAYDEANHVLDVYALGGKPTIGPLQKIFAREFLGIELPPEDPNAEPFSLGILLDPKFRFPTDPEDAVRSIVIAAARVLILGSREKLHFNPNVDFGPSSFQRMIERYIRQDNLPRSIMHLERVDLRFRMENGHEFNLSITRPNRSTIKSLATRDRLLAEKYLRQWGIIVHPKKVFDPPVDRDFGLLFQNFHIPPTHTISDSWSMDWNWHTINGKSGPYTTPLVCKHGERVRVRLLNFAPMQHHPIHLHGHTFWVTSHEGARIPKSAWVPRNNELVGVAQASSFEFIANNPGDWIFHCHMIHHMMNHMVKQVGPRMRDDASVDQYLANLSSRPQVDATRSDKFATPGYPQKMQGMEMSDAFMKAIWSRKEVRGMRANYAMSVKGLMTVLRVLPDDLYELVMNSDQPVEKGAVS